MLLRTSFRPAAFSSSPGESLFSYFALKDKKILTNSISFSKRFNYKIEFAVCLVTYLPGGYMSKRKNAFLYFLLILFSIVFIVVGNRITSNGASMFMGQTGSFNERDVYIVRADTILEIEESENKLSSTLSIIETRVKFSATIIFGERRGETLVVTQMYDNLSSLDQRPIEPGAWIFVYLTPSYSSEYFAGDYFRLHYIVIIAAVFFLFLLIFGKLKGFFAIIALVFSMLAIFLVFIPAILSGRNVYLWAVIICLFTIIINPYLTGGFNCKSTASALGCVGGVAVAGLVTLFLNNLLNISGAVNEEMMMVSFIIKDHPIDLRAVIFAAILIGALGATIDVSMSISSAINEMNETSENSNFASLLKYGMNVGRDIVGAQTSTLVLAYIGGSMSVLLLLITYQPSVFAMLNMEMVIVELLQSLIGGFTILFTIPATAFICAMMFDKKNNGKHMATGRKKSQSTGFKIGH